MNGIELIRIEWNNINGFIFTLLGIDYNNFEGELLGVHYGYKGYLVVCVLFFRFEITHPFN